MSLLPSIRSDYVQKGLWRNLTAPTYRQYLWTATNTQALVFLGLLGILGTTAGHKLWPGIRHSLQPALQLPDPANRRLTLSQADAIRALWADVKSMTKDMKKRWTEERGVRGKVTVLLDTISGNYRQPPRPGDTAIELRFGIFAVLNIISFALLGIIVPYFLAEGLQGEPVVHGVEELPGPSGNNRIRAIIDDGVRESVSRDFRNCVTDHGNWSETDYCMDLLSALPSYQTEEIDLADSVFAAPPYHFLSEKGDANSRALRLSRNTSLQDIGVNMKPGGTKLLHELTCVPASLSPFISQVNGSFNLRFEGLIPSGVPHGKGYSYSLHESMILKTPNTVGSGQEIQDEKAWHLHTEPIINHGDLGAKWYQTSVDATLPWIEFKGFDFEMYSRVVKGLRMIGGETDSRLRNFLLTFKPGESYDKAESPSDDPVFAARYPVTSSSGLTGYISDREVSAIGCAEVFRFCTADRCLERSERSDLSELPESEHDIWMELQYPGIMSVWVSANVDVFYGDPREDDDFQLLYGRLPGYQRRWQDEVARRFMRSMLRVRYISKYAAEQDANDLDPTTDTEPTISISQLYVNPDYTNINVWGSVATVCGYLYIIAASRWLFLFSPLFLSLKFLARASSWISENFKASIVFGVTGIRAAATNIAKYFRVAILVIWRQSTGSNTLPMDTLQPPQESNEADNPLRSARGQGEGVVNSSIADGQD